jgi:aryl-alcohol dehydrogenase-like predicted oxidoreductase
MKTRKLGKTGPDVSTLGLRALSMSGMYGPPDRRESLATIRAALDAGVTLIDTGDFYGMGHNEMLIGEALKGVPRDHVIVSVKFGALRDPADGWSGNDGRPDSVKNFLAYSLRRLGLDHIDIYRPARLDPQVPIEETVGAIAEMVKRGYVRHIGLSEVGVGTLRRAASVHPISDLQIEHSLISRDIEETILPAARELGVGVTAYLGTGLTAYGVLSRGLISGRWRKDAPAASDFRAYSPRFQGANVDANLGLVDSLREVAEARGLTVAQVAIAWAAAQGQDIVPLVGARRRDRLAEALGALDVILRPEDIAAIERAVPQGRGGGLSLSRRGDG